MSFESNMITQIRIRHLEVRALQCSSFDDFDRFVRKFENVKYVPGYAESGHV